MTLGQNIQALRHTAGLSQEGLGEKLGVSRQAISKWEADGAVPEVDKLIALARLFGVSLHDLLQVEETGREEPGDRVEQAEQPPEEGAENPPENEAPPRRNGRWRTALCVVLAAVVCVQGAALFRLNEKLEEQGDALSGQEAKIQQLEERTDALVSELSMQGSQISRLEQSIGLQDGRIELDPALPLVSAVDFTIETTEYGTRALKLNLVPAQSAEGMWVRFHITCPGGAARSHPASQLADSSVYTLSMICTDEELAGGFTVSAVFLDGTDRQYTQALVKISDITEDNWNAETLWDQ
ncbi:helix-turn-helix transcriptional regulator [uncultured Pseudoflavonifractor sp.]|uniref:helix-turn-helix transcriptional regulator n=1 Tax=uncultured Pseudoflavonifractor sp. TaxID=1221379 RepID=UPI0025D99C0D|nr:helix-turn-helix transcriptional regulator [uncultured Pseudoflavonifractor sp.]